MAALGQGGQHEEDAQPRGGAGGGGYALEADDHEQAHPQHDVHRHLQQGELHRGLGVLAGIEGAVDDLHQHKGRGAPTIVEQGRGGHVRVVDVEGAAGRHAVDQEKGHGEHGGGGRQGQGHGEGDGLVQGPLTALVVARVHGARQARQ